MTAQTLTAPLPSADLRRPARIGALATLLLVGVLGGWASTTVIGGAVIAQGQAMVEGRAKVVQHPDGGRVAAIAVQDGDRVAQGDLLLSLDPDLVATGLDIARTRLAAALALKSRLQAEQAGASTVSFAYPSLPAAVTREPLDTAGQEARQTEIFAARREMLLSARDRLAETLLQHDAQIDGLRGQIAAADEQKALLEAEIDSQQDLVSGGLTRQSALNTLLRNRAELSGRRAGLIADIARLEITKRDAELATKQSEYGFREEVATALRDATAESEELILEIVTRQGQLDRMEIRAPVAGIVHELQVSTVGGVVAPGDTLVQIVPLDEAMEFEVLIDPASIDQVHPGQTAELVLPGFDRQTTPRLNAHVTRVSPAAIADPQTGRSFYRADVAVTPAELARLGDLTLLPGMPVEAYLGTGDRTVLAYLLHPITSHIRRAFRE